jgi:hypothetical protein
MSPTQTKILALLAILAYAISIDALAVRVDNLYAAAVPLANPARPQDAFGVALTQVLVKVTGRREAVVDEARFPDASRFVQQYQIGADQTVWVRFDEAALRRELDRLGEPVWGSERPTTLVWMILDDGVGERRLLGGTAEDLSGDAEPGQRAPGAGNAALVEELQLTAEARGLPLLLPLVDTQELAAISLPDVWGGFVESIEAASLRYGPDAVLIGRVRSMAFDEPDVRWTLLLDGERFDWEGNIGSGANDVADFFAARLAASVGTSNQVLLSVDDVVNLDAYGRLSAYLEKLDLVEALAVDTVDGNRVVFSLTVRGDLDRLMRNIALQSVLTPVDAPRPSDDPFGIQAEAQSLHYRLVSGS